MADTALLHARAHSMFARDGGVHPPPEVVLSWPAPNFVDPEERGWEAPVILIVALSITFPVYAARIWARLAIAKNGGLDDILISIAMLPLIGLSVSSILAVKFFGFQWHAWDQTPASQIQSREMAIAVELNYLISTTLIKISILCFYRRLSGSLKTAFVYGVWAAIVSCVIYVVVWTFLLIFTCNPIMGFFHLFDLAWRLKNEVTCLDEGAIIVSCAIVSTIQDLVICLLPVFLVWNLRMPRRQKLGLLCIFALGLVTCVCGIVRTYYATYVYYRTYDITWYAYHGWIWTTLEADLGMICASAPALKVFFKRYFSDSTSSNGYGRDGTYGESVPMSRSRGPKQTMSHTATASRARPEDVHDSNSPFTGIKVTHGVHIEERDDISQKSYASTSQLTAFADTENQSWNTPSGWIQGRGMSTERDMERGTPTVEAQMQALRSS